MSASSATVIRDIAGWSFTSCPCVAEWWPLVQQMAVRRGLVRQKLDVSQGGYNVGGVSASAGTHDEGGVLDLRQYSEGVVRLLREAGSAAHHRKSPPFDSDHTHLCLIGCPHLQGRPTAYRRYPIGAAKQVESYLAGRDGLAMNGPDTGPQVVPVRTWREGVAWMRSQLNPTADAPTTPDSPTPGTPTTIPSGEDFIMAITQAQQADFNALLKAALDDRDIQIKIGEASLGNRYGDVTGDGKPDTAGEIIRHDALMDRVTQDRVNQLLNRMDAILDRAVTK